MVVLFLSVAGFFILGLGVLVFLIYRAAKKFGLDDDDEADKFHL